MSHVKAKGSTKNGRDSRSKRLGVKLFDGQIVQCGNIVIRQRGTKFRAGENVKMGKDYTIFAAVTGVIKFSNKKVKKYDGNIQKATYVNVIAQA